MNLGFGVYDKTIGARLPARFLSSETQASGINMQHFMMNHPELDRFVNGESKMGRCTVILLLLKVMSCSLCRCVWETDIELSSQLFNR